jgi:hypothetical protein
MPSAVVIEISVRAIGAAHLSRRSRSPARKDLIVFGRILQE